MFRTVLAHLRAQWIGVLALLIALGTGSAYAANTVFSTDIVDGEVKTADIANNAVRSTKIGTGQVLNQDVGADAVDGSKVADGSLGVADLGFNSVGTDEIQTDGVGATEVSDGSIDSGEIFDNSLTASDLAASSVGPGELQDGAVANVELANSAVNSAKVASNSLTTADIAGADVQGSISLAAGSVPNGRCEQFNSPNGGAEQNQGVILVTRGALQQGIVISAQRVPSDGNVTVNVCNFSGTTQAAIVDLPVRVITFG